MIKIATLACLATLAAGCRSYELKPPENFDAEPLAVSGKRNALRLGEYQLSDFERSWTKGSGMQVMSVKSEKRRQQYQFQLRRPGAAGVGVRCEFSANERTVGVRSGWELMAGEGATLDCAIAHADTTTQLKLETDGDAVLAGLYKAKHEYRVDGVGTALFGGGRKGTAGGFHFYEGDRLIALAQIIGTRRVLFARGVDDDRRAELVPAIAALILMDESVREF